MSQIAEVLAFWFAAGMKEKWFKKDPAFDREVRDRLGAQHETPPPAVCGRPHVAVLKSDQLPLAGGGSSSLPDFSHTCRPITREYVEDAISWETVEDLVESVGLDLDELAALPLAERASRMRDPEVKQRVLEDSDVQVKDAGSMQALAAA